MELLNESLKLGVAPAIVVSIYLVIVKIIDNRKERSSTKLNADLTKSINNISEFLVYITKDIINRERDKCRVAIEDSMYSSGMRLVNFVSTTVINNNIEVNKDTILANIKNIVNTEYYSIYSTLAMYKINGVVASEVMNIDWIGQLENDMIDVIYNNRLNADDKILSFSNKVTLRFQTYVTYLINNVVK